MLGRGCAERQQESLGVSFLFGLILNQLHLFPILMVLVSCNDYYYYTLRLTGLYVLVYFGRIFDTFSRYHWEFQCNVMSLCFFYIARTRTHTHPCYTNKATPKSTLSLALAFTENYLSKGTTLMKWNTPYRENKKRTKNGSQRKTRTKIVIKWKMGK